MYGASIIPPGTELNCKFPLPFYVLRFFQRVVLLVVLFSVIVCLMLGLRGIRRYGFVGGGEMWVDCV